MNGFNDEHNELDDYIMSQLERHYGKDTVKEAAKIAPPPPPKRRKPLLSIAAIVCAVLFITGALIFGGVMLKGGMGNITLPFALGSSQNESSEASAPDTSSVISDNSSADSSSESVSSEEYTPGTPPVIYDPENDTGSETSSEESSFFEEKSSSEDGSSEEMFPEDPSETISGNESEYIYPEDEYESRRVDSHSLPSFEDDTEYIEESENNSETNPYDNVTTGRRAWAGIGIFLMIASLVSAVALYNLYTDKENTI